MTLSLDPDTTALVLIDLQNGIVGLPLAPRSGDEVAENGRALAGRFRQAGAPVVLVNVVATPDSGGARRQPVDRPMPAPEGDLPPDWSELVGGLAGPGDILVTKHGWGAFHGTDLDSQLRLKGVKTVVVGGIATNLGVESTARQAHEHGYAVVIAEDVTTSLSAEMHGFSAEALLPMISRVAPAGSLEFARPS